MIWFYIDWCSLKINNMTIGKPYETEIWKRCFLVSVYCGRCPRKTTLTTWVSRKTLSMAGNSLPKTRVDRTHRFLLGPFSPHFQGHFSYSIFLKYLCVNFHERTFLSLISESIDFKEYKLLIEAMSDTRLLLSLNCYLWWIIFLARPLVLLN